MIKVTRKLFSAVSEHKQVAKLFDQKARFWTANQASSPVPKLNVVKYFQRNIFSVIFLAVYSGLRIPRDRRIIYGLVNRCIRGIVTGADNILDHEYNPIFTFHGWNHAPERYKSLITALLSQLIFDDVLRDGEDSGLFGRLQTREVKMKLSKNLGAIGIQDAGDQTSSAPDRRMIPAELDMVIATPDEIKEKVHELKGGSLLALAMHAPMVIEPYANGISEEKLTNVQNALHNIGMGLQMLDDIVDFYEDIVLGKSNYLVSYIYHFGSTDEKRKLISAIRNCSSDWHHGDIKSSKLESPKPSKAGQMVPVKDMPPLEQSYEKSLTEVIELSTSPVIAGFRSLEEEGFFMGEREARKFLKMLFVARGASGLWRLSKK